MKLFSLLILPFLVLGILMLAWARKVNMFSAFTLGAGEGAKTILDIIPSLIGLFVAIGVFKASGAMELVVGLLTPVGKMLGIDGELLPLVLMRPVSGSASLALVQDIIKEQGVDTYLGRAAAVMMGSTETIFYTITVYFGAVKIKKTRHTVWAAIMADMTAIIMAILMVKNFIL